MQWSRNHPFQRGDLGAEGPSQGQQGGDTALELSWSRVPIPCWSGTHTLFGDTASLQRSGMMGVKGAGEFSCKLLCSRGTCQRHACVQSPKERSTGSTAGWCQHHLLCASANHPEVSAGRRCRPCFRDALGGVADSIGLVFLQNRIAAHFGCAVARTASMLTPKRVCGRKRY